MLNEEFVVVVLDSEAQKQQLLLSPDGNSDGIPIEVTTFGLEKTFSSTKLP